MIRILILSFLLLLSCSPKNEHAPAIERIFYKNNLSTSEKGKSFIKERESFRSYAYWDNKGWAVGYGNTYYQNNRPVKKGDRITREEGEKLFDFIIVDFETAVNDNVSTKLNQNQFDALVSYSYNRGINSLRKSTLLKMVNQNPNNQNIYNQFILEWGTNQEFKNGLIRRRKMEAEMYFSDYDPPPEPITEEQKQTNKNIFYLIFSVLLVLLFVLKNRIVKITINKEFIKTLITKK
jgi:lysozyme